jgi:threonine/homoserine/homoserine lactone efflux protein
LFADQLAAFFLASVILALAPGPDNLFVLAQSALYGRRAGLLVTLGLCTGLLVHTSLVAFGLAALLLSFPPASTLLKLLGGLYLLYLAWRTLGSVAGMHQSKAAIRPAGGQLYRRGIIMNITNPKVSMFFLAFLPAFVRPDGEPVLLQAGILGALFMVATLIVFGSIAIFAGLLGNVLQRHDGIRKGLNVLAGTVLILLAGNLLLSAFWNR